MGLLDRLLARKPAQLDRARSDSGRAHTSGFLDYDETNVSLRGRAGLEIFDRMWRTDPDVRRVVNMAFNPIVAATWGVQAKGGEDADEQAQQIADDLAWALGLGDENADGPLDGGWIGHLAETFPLLIRSGFVPSEIVWGRRERDGRQLLVPVKLGVRLPRTIYRWNQDPLTQELTGIDQLRIGYAGWEQRAGTDEGGYTNLPRQDLLYYRVGAEGDNWEGQSLLRPVYKPWFFKDNIERLDAIAHERESVGLPVVYPPSAAALDDPILDQLEEDLAALRSGELAYLVMPGPHAENAPEGMGWRLDMVGLAGTESAKRDPLSSLSYYRDAISAAFLQEFMRLGQSGEGARATADVQQDPYLMACQALADIPRTEANRILVRRFVQLNYGKDAPAPSITVSLTEGDIASLRDYAVALAGGGLIHPDDPLEDFLRERGNLPAADPAQRQARQEAEQAAAEAEAAAGMPQDPAAVPGAKGHVKTVTRKTADGKTEREREEVKNLDDGEPVGNKAPDALQLEGRCAGCGEDAKACECEHTLSHEPYHALMDADGMTARLDTFKDTLTAALAAHTPALVALVTDDSAAPPEPPQAFLAALDGEFNALTHYGYQTVLDELHRQATPQAIGLAAYTLDEPMRGVGRRAMLAARAILQAAWQAIQLRKLAGDSDDLAHAADEAIKGAIRAAARDHGPSLLAGGRDEAAETNAGLIRGARYTSILDRSRCANCKAADDNVLRTLDDPVRISRKPPNKRCESTKSGTNRCRCIEFYELADEAPAYLEAANDAITLAKAKWNPAEHPRDDDGRFIAKLSGHAADLLEQLAPKLTGPADDPTTPSKRVGRGLANKSTKVKTATKNGKTFEVKSHEIGVSGKGADEFLDLVNTALDQKLYGKAANPSSAKQGLERAREELLKAKAAADFHAGEVPLPKGPGATDDPPAFKPGNVVQIVSPATGEAGSLAHAIVKIDGDTATVVTPKSPSLGGGTVKQVPVSQLAPHTNPSLQNVADFKADTFPNADEAHDSQPPALPDTIYGKFNSLGVSLGGSTGAKLYDDVDGNKFVVKNTVKVSKEHLANEAAADAAYRAAGVATPDSKLTDDGAFKVSRYLEGGTPLSDLTGMDRFHAVNKLRENFVIDAVLGSWDVIGLDQDNVLVKDGVPYRIDNGGSLRYRAQGEPKGDDWNQGVTELWTLREKGSAAAVFNGMSDDEVFAQVKTKIADGSLSAVVASIEDPELRAEVAARVNQLAVLAQLHTTGSPPEQIRGFAEAKAANGFSSDPVSVDTAGASLNPEPTVFVPAGFTQNAGKTIEQLGLGVGDEYHVSNGDGEYTWKITAASPGVAKIVDASDPDGPQHEVSPGIITPAAYKKGSAPAAAAATAAPDHKKPFTVNDGSVTFKDLKPGDFVQYKKGGHKHQVIGHSGNYVKVKNLNTGKLKHWYTGNSAYANGPTKPYAIMLGNGLAAGTGQPLSGGSSTPAAPAAYDWTAPGNLFDNANPISALEEGRPFTKPDGVVAIKGESTGGSGYWAYPVDGSPKFKIGGDKVPAKVGLHAPGVAKLAELKANQGAPSAASQMAAGSGPTVTTSDQMFRDLPTGHQAETVLDQVQEHNAGDKLSKPQRDAIQAYTGGGFRPINKQLRASAEFGSVDTAKQIAAMDDVFKTLDGIPQDILIWRAVTGSAGDKYRSAQVGQTVSDNGFISSSTSESFAEGWGVPSQATLMRIRWPKGSKGLWVSKPGEAISSQGAGEHELILPRGVSFRVIERLTRPNGYVELVVEPIYGNA